MLNIDGKLTWKQHIDFLSSRLSSVCFHLRTLSKTVSVNVIKMVYYGLFESLM